MLGVVLVAHGDLADSFLKVAEQMTGRQEHLATISYNLGDDMEAIREAISRSVDTVDRQSGVIILTDMFGGVPCNLAISVAHAKGVEVVSGLNLAMLLKVLTTRQSMPLSEAVREASKVAKDYIHILSDIMAGLEEPAKNG